MFAKTLITVCCALVYVNCAVKNRQNVVLIVLDDLRASAVGVYGDPRAHTPNMDRLATTGLTFEHAYAQQALCAPSRNSMLTSRRPDTLRLYDFYSYWRDTAGNFTTLPQYFRAHGYHAASIGKIFHPGVSSNYTDDYPLSWSRPPYHPPSAAFLNAPVCGARGHLQSNLLCPIRLSRTSTGTLPDIESVRHACRFLRQQRVKSRPFFLAVGLHKPHIPFQFPPHYLRHHPLANYYWPDGGGPAATLPPVAWNPYVDIRTRDDVHALNVSFPYGPVPWPFRAAIRQHYYAAASYADALLGRMLRHVNRSDTVVLVTGDHGWSLGEHGEWSKYSNFEVALRVPLIVAAPGGNSRTTHAAPVELLDIFPTLVQLAGLPAVPRCVRPAHERLCTEGRPLGATMDAHRFAFSQYPRPSVQPAPDSDRPRLGQITVMGCSVRSHQHRYTLWVRFNATSFAKDWRRVVGEELYDHSIDPDETVNLSGRPPLDVVRLQLRDILIARFSSSPSP